MKNKRPIVFIVVGIICAVLAAVGVQKYMAARTPSAEATDGLEILVAMRDIDFGEPLVPAGRQDANVVIVADWPKNFKPEGAVTDAALVSDQVMRANALLYKHLPILERQMVPEDEFIPDDMCIERISVDRDEIKSGTLRPGMKVDVFQVVGNMPVDFMRSVQIYALGRIDSARRPVKEEDPPPNVFLLIKREDSTAFLKAKYAYHFLVREAADPHGEGPVLVDTTVAQEVKRSEVRELLAQGRGLMTEGQYEKAFALLQDAAGRYPELTDLTDEAAREVAKCRGYMAEGLYQKARDAAEDEQDFTAALRWLDMLENEFSEMEAGEGVRRVLQKAKELRVTTAEGLQRHRDLLQYRTVLKDLDAALSRGNLPRAEELLADLHQFSRKGLEPEADLPPPADALQDYAEKIGTALAGYEIDKKVLESHLKQGNYEQARVKFREIKETFPQHPDIDKLEELVSAAQSDTA